MRILIVEDKVRMACLLRDALQREGYLTLLAADGERALDIVGCNRVDAMILDIMIPRLDGFEVLRRMREMGMSTPAIILTAKDHSQDVVHGLNLGADDYLTKPFDLDVLLARLRAILRRAPALKPEKLRVGDLQLCVKSHSLERGGRTITLTPTEFSLMEVLMRSAGHVVRKETLAEIGWSLEGEFSDSTLYVFMGSLRRKIQTAGEAPILHTVRGVGYRLRDAAS